MQCVVDIVRDLLSPVAETQHYKNGMQMDGDGFMDIDWCTKQTVNDWEDFLLIMRSASERRACASTQFNPFSTRGHCILIFEVERPHTALPNTKG